MRAGECARRSQSHRASRDRRDGRARGRARILRRAARRERPLRAVARGLRVIVGGFIQGQPSGRMFRAGWDRMSVYLPVILMGLIALGTYWLARNTPTVGIEPAAPAATHDPDQYMRNFSVKSFDASGR